MQEEEQANEFNMGQVESFHKLSNFERDLLREMKVKSGKGTNSYPREQIRDVDGKTIYGCYRTPALKVSE